MTLEVHSAYDPLKVYLKQFSKYYIYFKLFTNYQHMDFRQNHSVYITSNWCVYSYHTQQFHNIQELVHVHQAKAIPRKLGFFLTDLFFFCMETFLSNALKSLSSKLKAFCACIHTQCMIRGLLARKSCSLFLSTALVLVVAI